MGQPYTDAQRCRAWLDRFVLNADYEKGGCMSKWADFPDYQNEVRTILADSEATGWDRDAAFDRLRADPIADMRQPNIVVDP